MSHKVSTFLGLCPAPKTIDRFLVWIPNVPVSPFRVSSTVYPQQTRSTIRVSVSGQPVFLPGKMQVSGTWSCVLDESTLSDANLQIQILKNLVATKDSRILRYKLIEPTIFITDQFTGMVPMHWCTLKGAWLESVEEIQLDWSQPDKPVRWKLTFKYSSMDRYPFSDEDLAKSTLGEILKL